MKQFIAFLLAAFAVAGCTLTEKVVFNPKMGGTISYELDATEFMNFAQSMDTTGGVSYNLADSLGDAPMLAQALNAVKGISGAKMEGSGNVITLSYSFDNLDALNAAHKEMNQLPDMGGFTGGGYQKVTPKGKKELIYRTFPLGSSPDDSTYASMGLMLTYKLDATFPKKVKSVGEKAMEVAGNKITWTSSVEDNGAKYAFDGVKIKF